MTSNTWQPPEYTDPSYSTLAVCEDCGAAIIDTQKHTRWHFRDSVRGHDSYGADLRITEQQVKDYGFNDTVWVCKKCGRPKGCGDDCEDMNCDHCYCYREGRDG